MASCSNTSVSVDESNNNSMTTTIRWDACPVEILLIIFEKLDITSLRCCLLVSVRWKEIALNICEKQELWQELAEDGIANYAVTQRVKSLLGWKELYFNSLLWDHLQLATIAKSCEINKPNIKQIHVYKGNLIVVNGDNVEYYNIESSECVRTISLTCEDFQENDDMIIVMTNNNIHYKLTMFGKLHDSNDFKQVENHFTTEGSVNACEISHSSKWLIHGNCCYIIDWKCVLWKAYRSNNSWNVKSLARYYGGYQLSAENTMNAIHVVKDEVFVALRMGDLLQALSNGLGFRKIRLADIPTYVITGPNINKRLPYKEGLDTFSAFVKAPFKTAVVEDSRYRDKFHFHYDDPEMTCGLQHGEVVFLGFEDGRVEIRLLKNIFHSFNPAVKINIRDFDKDAIEDPAVTGLEVYEVKHMHILFVKTSSKLYQLLIKYPDILLED